MSALVDALLARSPLQFALRRRNRDRVAVLAYHGIEAPDQFGRHLDWLVEHRTVISLEQFTGALATNASLPPYPTLITFDDGDRSVFDCGVPALQERGLPGVAFVVSDLIDSNQPFWWSAAEEHSAHGGTTSFAPGLAGRALVNALKRVPDPDRRRALDELAATSSAMPRRHQLAATELRTMASSGVAIGNHTRSHPCLDRCPPDTVREEIASAHERLCALLGHRPRAFAYPNGDYTDSARSVLTDLDYAAAFLFDHALADLRHCDQFAVSRVRVNSHTSMNRFRAIVSGLHPGVHRLRGGR